jgi:hypothetical protein
MIEGLRESAREVMGSMIKNWVWTLAVVPVFILWACPSEALLSVSANLEQPTIFVGQKTRLQVEVTVDAQPAPKPSLPRIEGLGFTEISGTNVSQKWINGAFQMSQIYTYWVFSDQPGSYEIFPITVEKNGQRRTANKVVLTVMQQGEKPESGQSLPNYFLRAEVNQETAYINEPILLTFKQYSTLKPTRNIQLDLDPNVFKGFWHEVIENDRLTYQMEDLNGRQYYVVEIQKVLLFPLTVGEVEIEPVNLTSILERPASHPRNRRSMSMFDDFNSFFNRTENIRTEMRSNKIALNILPLPSEGRPEEFSGAVGNYSLSATVDKESLEAGQALTLRVTVRGSGNLKNLSEPILSRLEGFDRYESTKKENIRIENGTLAGNVIFEYLLIPKNENVTTIGPVKYIFFNPELKQYLSLETPAIQLDVKPSTRAAEETIVIGGAGRSRRSIQVLGEDLRYIHTRADLHEKEFYSANNIGMAQVLTFHLVPLGVLGGFLLLLQRERKRQENPAWARRTEAPRFARKALRECENHLQDRSVEIFYATLHKALTRYFSDKWNVALQGLTEEQRKQTIEESLHQPDLVQRVENLFTACDEARFAPGALTEENMKKHLETAREVFRQA